MFLILGPIGAQELLVLAVLALLIIGPRKLPEVARTLGRTFRNFKQTTADLMETINQEVKTPLQEVKKPLDDLKRPLDSVRKPLEVLRNPVTELKRVAMDEIKKPAAQPTAKTGPVAAPPAPAYREPDDEDALVIDVEKDDKQPS